MVLKLKNAALKVKNFFKDCANRYQESKFGNTMKKFFDKGNRRFVLTLYVIAFFVFALTLLSNYMTIVVSGDFKLQEVPFYYNGHDDWWKSLLSMEYVMWDDSGFLGQNNIGTNTFYYLWNIFFLPTLLVPRVLVPQALAFMIITKFVLAGYVMKRLLDYHGISENSSKIVAIAYAFSGWSFYYLWFNHFLEIAVLFPWVLFGIEKVLKEKKVGHLIISLFLSAMTNYFFFIMFCFCGVIYALFRYFQLWKYNTSKERLIIIGLGILSFAVAIIMSAIILIPAFKVAMQSSRAQSSTYSSQLVANLKDIFAVIKGNKEKGSLFSQIKKLWVLVFDFTGPEAKKAELYPLVSYFYPPYSCFDSPLFANNGYDNTNCSLFMYTPLTLLLVPSLIRSIREKKISHVIGFIGSLLMIFSPFFYYCFTGFTSVCYGRWQLFIVAIACIYIAYNLDHLSEMKGWYFDVSIVICLVSEIILFVYALKYQGTMGTNVLLSKDVFDDRLIYALVQPLYILILYIVLRHQFKNKKVKYGLRIAIAIEAIVVGNAVLLGQGTIEYDSMNGGINDVNSSINLVKKLNKTDDSYFRIFNTSCDRDSNNLAMIEGYRGLATFHSMYNYELDEFGEWSRITYTQSSSSWRPWSMGVHEKRANLDTFLGVKYYLVNSLDDRISQNDDMLYIDSGNWVINGSDSIVTAFNASEVDYNSGEYVIKSFKLKETNGKMDVYTVVFESNTDDTDNRIKTYNVTLPNDNMVNITVGSNGNWYFNNLDIGVKGCPKSLNSSNSRYTIKGFQRLANEGNNYVYNFIFTNNESIKCVLNNGEDKNIPFGYKEIMRDKYNVVYENENFINLGFAFDSLVNSEYISSQDNYSNMTYYGRVMKNEMAYVRSAILSESDIEEIKSNYPQAAFNTYMDRSNSLYSDSNPLVSDLKVYNIDNSKIKIYLQNWNHEKGIALDFASPVNYPGDSIKQIYWNSYMDVDLSSYDVASEAKTRGGAYVTVNGRMGENLFITLYGIGEQGNEIELARDIHMKHAYDKGSDWKHERGFYVNDRVTKIRVRAYDTFAEGKKFAKPNITVQYYDTYKANIDKLKQNELKDVKIKTNGFSFKTNYQDTKMEVLTIPYDEGFKLTRKDSEGKVKEIKLYKAQGGFNSFVAEAGDYSYSLDYVTPGLQLGILGFGVGFTMFAALYILFDLRYKVKEYYQKQFGI